MARTSSAFPRGSRVSEVAVESVRNAILSTMFLLRNSSISRQALLGGALYLALLGVALPLIPGLPLSSLLLALAAAFILTALSDDVSIESTAFGSIGQTAESSLIIVPAERSEFAASALRNGNDAILLPHVGDAAPARTIATSPARLDSATAAELMPRISHEIRTPLNAIIGFADLMAKEIFGPLGHPRYREYLDHIRDSSRDLLKSSEDTLALAQLLADPTTPEDAATIGLERLAAEAWETIAARAAERNITVAFDIDPEVEVQGDRRALRQSVASILSSAIDSAQACAVIRVTAEPGVERVRFEVRLSANAMRLDACHETLGLAIARTLLDLQGTTLVHMAHTLLGWRATTWLEVAAQADFFAVAETPHAAAARDAHPCEVAAHI
jgi:signal transduction histidine kinase